MSASKKKAAVEHWNRAIGTVISATRRDADVSQSELAKMMEWHRSTIAKIEAGELGVRAAELILIAKALKVGPDVLWQRILRW